MTSISQSKIALNISQKFHNKTNLDGEHAKHNYSSSFHPADLTPDELIAHATSGKAWTLHRFDGAGRKGDTWVSSQLVALDLDDTPLDTAEVAAHPFVAAYALVVYPTPSSTPEKPKHRVVFLLDDILTHAGRWQALQRGLLNHFADWKPDPACKDLARLFYGSDKPGYVVIGKTLPLTVAGSLTAYEAYEDDIAHDLEATRTDAPGTTIMLEGDRLKAYAEATFNRTIDDLRATTDERNPALYKAAISLFSKAMGGWGFTEGQVETALLEAMHVNGYTAQKGEHKTRSTLESALKAATPEALPVLEPCRATPKTTTPPALADRIRPVTLDTFDADRRVNLRYISDIDIESLYGSIAILIKSAINTGKTELVKRYIADIERKMGRSIKVLVITHLQALADNIAERLNVDCYKRINGSLIKSAQKLVCSYDSLDRVSGVKYDLVVIDEIEQFHRHLFGGTMRDGKPTVAYRTLKQVITNANWTVGLDAHATNTSKQWFKSVVAGNVTAIENTYTHAWGDLHLHAKQDTVIAAALAKIKENVGTVVIPTSSKKRSEIFDYIVRQTGIDDDAVMLVNSDTSEGTDAQDLIRRVNERLPELRVLICSPSLATGIDVKARVAGVYGVFLNRPLAPTDMLQMVGRFRNADERHVYVQAQTLDVETDWTSIYLRHERRAIRTAHEAGFKAHGIDPLTSTQRGILRLQAMLDADHNRQRGDTLSSFVALATREGFNVVTHDGDNLTIKGLLKDARDAVAEERKQTVIDADPVSHVEMDAHRIKGTVTPEVRAGYERFKIEDTVGLTITPTIYDDLYTPRQRSALRRFTDLDADADDLHKLDRLEATNDVLLSKRKHFTMTRNLIAEAIRRVFPAGVDDASELTETEIGNALASFLSERLDDVQTFLDRRADLSERPLAVFRRILDHIGVTLEGKRVMRDGERFWLYSIDADSVATMRRYATARRAHLREKSEITTFTDNDIPISRKSGNPQKNDEYQTKMWGATHTRNYQIDRNLSVLGY